MAFYELAFDNGRGVPSSSNRGSLLDDSVCSFAETCVSLFTACIADPPAEEELGAASRRYRDETMSKLQVSLMAMEEGTGQGGLDQASADLLGAEVDRLEKLHRLWHLVEVFHLSSKFLSLELCVWINKSYSGLEPVDEGALSEVHMPEVNLKLYNTSNEELAYWPAVYRLAMQGRLPEVWKLLRSHSDVLQAARQGGVGLQACRELGELLLGHPYAAYLQDGGMSHDLLLSLNLYAELMKWRARVEAARFSVQFRDFYGSIPEVDVLFQILAPANGDLDPLLQNCDGDWELLVVAELLYHFPPPLSREALSGIVQDAMQRLPATSDVEREFRSELEGIMTIRSVGTIIRRMYEISVRPGEACRIGAQPIVGLLVLAMLCFLLQHSRTERDIGTLVLPETGCTFFEQLVIEIVREGSELDLPLPLLLGLVRWLPQGAMQRSVLLNWLPKRPVRSDEECWDVAEALGQYELSAEANAALVARGHWWAAQNAPTSAVNALAFFLEAGDSTQVLAALDLVLFQLAQCTALHLAARGLPLSRLTRAAPRSSSSSSSAPKGFFADPPGTDGSAAALLQSLKRAESVVDTAAGAVARANDAAAAAASAGGFANAVAFSASASAASALFSASAGLRDYATAVRVAVADTTSGAEAGAEGLSQAAELLCGLLVESPSTGPKVHVRFAIFLFFLPPPCLFFLSHPTPPPLLYVF